MVLLETFTKDNSVQPMPINTEGADALLAVASALLQQACELLEQIASMDDGER